LISRRHDTRSHTDINTHTSIQKGCLGTFAFLRAAWPPLPPPHREGQEKNNVSEKEEVEPVSSSYPPYPSPLLHYSSLPFLTKGHHWTGMKRGGGTTPPAFFGKKKEKKVTLYKWLTSSTPTDGEEGESMMMGKRGFSERCVCPHTPLSLQYAGVRRSLILFLRVTRSPPWPPRSGTSAFRCPS
jgi:hypothetical protein